MDVFSGPIDAEDPFFANAGKSKIPTFPFCLNTENFAQIQAEHELSSFLDAMNSLYRHVLPNLGKKFLTKLLAGPGLASILLLRPIEDVLAEHAKFASDPLLLEEEKRATEERRQQNKKAKGIEDETNSDTSSFSYDKDEVDQGSEETSQEGEGESESESEEEGSEKEPDFEDQCIAEAAAAAVTSTTATSTQEDTQQLTPSIPTTLTVKSRLVGCITLEFVPNQMGLRILQVTLLGVRLKYQRCGAGAHLLRLATESGVLPPHDVVITFADHSSVPFWRSQGFSDDPILNWRFKFCADDWDQSTLMSRPNTTLATTTIPRPLLLGEEGRPSERVIHYPALEKAGSSAYRRIEDVDKMLDGWKARKIQEYSDDMFLFESFKSEIAKLREKVMRQDLIIDYLSSENKNMKQKNILLERELAMFHEQALKQQQRAQRHTLPPAANEQLSTNEERS